MVIKNTNSISIIRSSSIVTMESQQQQQQLHHQLIGFPTSSIGGSAVPANNHLIPRRRESVTLSDYYSDNEPNDLDFNEMTKIAQYREAIEIIQRKCEGLSKDNEKLVRRLQFVKRVTKQKERDVTLLKGRLDVYNDDWRTAQPEPSNSSSMYPSLIPNQQAKPRKTKIRKTKSTSLDEKEKPAAGGANGPNKAAPAPKTAGKRKRLKGEKQERDPNAPKRPANPFFQFCQEQRALVMEELNSEQSTGQPELSKQELTKQLANRWRTMNNETKQIYIDKYESSKQKYNQEMQSYKRDAEKPT